MNTRTQVDVVMADDTPAPASLEAGQPQEPETVDVTPDPNRRIIYLAPTKAQGEAEATEQGIEPVAILTPRSVDAARGITADAIMSSADLTTEQRDTLTGHALPSLATRED